MNYSGTVQSVGPSKYPNKDGAIPWRLNISGQWYSLNQWPCPVAEGDFVEFDAQTFGGGKTLWITDIMHGGDGSPSMSPQHVTASAPPATMARPPLPPKPAPGTTHGEKDQWIFACALVGHWLDACGNAQGMKPDGFSDIAAHAVMAARRAKWLFSVDQATADDFMRGRNMRPRSKPAEAPALAPVPVPPPETDKDIDPEDDIPF